MSRYPGSDSEPDNSCAGWVYLAFALAFAIVLFT